MFKGYIYRHWIINDKGQEKSYIGQTARNNVDDRWGKNGKGYLGKHNGRKSDHKMARAIKKYGWDNFKHNILLTIECETLEDLVFWLDEWEKYYIWLYDSFHNGYNSTTGGGNGIRSAESRQKMSESHKGKPCPTKGKPLSEEHKQKLSKARKGKPAKQFSEEHKQNLSKALKGKRQKKVICLETLQVFDSSAKAGEWCGVGCTAIKNHINGKKTSGTGKHPETGEKLHWMYYKDYEMTTKEKELKN